jgi:hypothetical protein
MVYSDCVQYFDKIPKRNKYTIRDAKKLYNDLNGNVDFNKCMFIITCCAIDREKEHSKTLLKHGSYYPIF